MLVWVALKINLTTSDLFSSTFKTINENFQQMFTKLFDGGTAKLVLVNEEDILECGIEIIARPPGKRLQNVSLLSGGERTLTAVSLLFAIYMIKPSPFCLLDELDAPLDDSNIGRFIDVLKGFLSQSQFIIITHNQRTIASANILYGVTMPTRGVSELVSMRFSSHQENAEKTLIRPARSSSTRSPSATSFKVISKRRCNQYSMTSKNGCHGNQSRTWIFTSESTFSATHFCA